ncbi:phage terminase small subunit gpNu1 [Pseudogulbenkiania sp. NH8B]|uniref:terminase small subunit n=1 Tax=Pseudogulbenkiania sp. (strain NH8B) TaxID=748280 RepID=UPI0002279576|nr:terminase small subunit [Pseudogulbenkiania sp. NH8B]BAK75401.1 phage terminase small subunit gpNu1 [Pseudogulbenkiania sp. NH8B]
MGKIVNKRDLAQIIGVSERTLTEWQREGMPMVLASGRGSSNQYDTAAVIAWRIAREVNGAEKESQKDRLDRLRGDQIERQMAVDARELIPSAEIAPALGQFISDAVALITGIPDKYAPIIEAAGSLDAQHAVLEDAVDEIRQLLGSYEFRDRPDNGPATEADASAAQDQPR